MRTPEQVAEQIEAHIAERMKGGQHPSKSDLAWMRSFPVRMREGELHPWYGPCDGMGVDGECSECAKERFATFEEWEAWLQSKIPRCATCGQALPSGTDF